MGPAPFGLKIGGAGGLQNESSASQSTSLPVLAEQLSRNLGPPVALWIRDRIRRDDRRFDLVLASRSSSGGVFWTFRRGVLNGGDG